MPMPRPRAAQNGAGRPPRGEFPPPAPDFSVLGLEKRGPAAVAGGVKMVKKFKAFRQNRSCGWPAAAAITRRFFNERKRHWKLTAYSMKMAVPFRVRLPNTGGPPYMDGSGRIQDRYSENYANRKVWTSSKHKRVQITSICSSAYHPGTVQHKPWGISKGRAI